MMLAAGPENMVSTGAHRSVQGQGAAVRLEDVDGSLDFALLQGSHVRRKLFVPVFGGGGKHGGSPAGEVELAGDPVASSI